MIITVKEEIKKKYKQMRISASTGSTQAVVIVGLDGWDFSKYDNRTPDQWGRSSLGKNVRISMNGPLALTYEEWVQLRDEIDNTYETLKEA